MLIQSVNKCMDCLSAFAVAEQARKMQCACGGSKVEYMGRVQGDKLKRTEERCACDARCTNAQGPVCDCQCGGLNHGTGRTVSVAITSGIPTAMVDAEAIERGQAWRKQLQATEYALCVRYGDSYVAFKARQFVSNKTVWFELRNTERLMSKARQSKTWKTRTEILSKLAA